MARGLQDLETEKLTPIGQWTQARDRDDALGLSIPKIAKLIDVSTTYMYRIVCKQQYPKRAAEPSEKIVIKLGKALNDLEGCLIAAGYSPARVDSITTQTILAEVPEGVKPEDYIMAQIEDMQRQIDALNELKNSRIADDEDEDVDMGALMEFRPALLLDPDDQALVHQFIELLATRDKSNSSRNHRP